MTPKPPLTEVVFSTCRRQGVVWAVLAYIVAKQSPIARQRLAVPELFSHPSFPFHCEFESVLAFFIAILGWGQKLGILGMSSSSR